MQRFSLLDTDQDGYLTEDNVMSVPADVVDEAFGQTLPGEVRDREWDFIYLWSATIIATVSFKSVGITFRSRYKRGNSISLDLFHEIQDTLKQQNQIFILLIR